MLNCLIPVTPLTHIPTRSVAFNVAAVQLWLGRWAILDSSGLAIPPGSPGAGLGGAYLVWGPSHAVPDGLAAGISIGTGLQLDAAGRLIALTSGVRVATCEAISASALTFRTLGA